MKYTKLQLQEAKDYLLNILNPGDTIYTNILHVSRSGMYRVISLHVVKDNQLVNISWNAAKLLEGYDEKHNGCKASGCGMDMGFHLVYNLGYALFPNGFTCTGKNCPSNDHRNKPYPECDGKMLHTSGGYAFDQSWV